MADFCIETTTDGLTVAGELDVATVPAIRRALEAFAGRAVTLDLAGLTFMDSTGIKALLSTRKAGTDVRIVNPSIHIRLLLELTGLTNELGVQ